SFEDSNRVVVISPTSGSWPALSSVSVQIVGGSSGITDVAGNHVATAKTVQFTTRSVGVETLTFENPHYLMTEMAHFEIFPLTMFMTKAPAGRTLGNAGHDHEGRR